MFIISYIDNVFHLVCNTIHNIILIVILLLYARDSIIIIIIARTIDDFFTRISKFSNNFANIISLPLKFLKPILW